jgi:inorganic pyrophosphatase
MSANPLHLGMFRLAMDSGSAVMTAVWTGFDSRALSQPILCSMQRRQQQPPDRDARHAGPPELDVVIEIPMGSFLKRGSSGRVDFISPFPCPFNYGSVEDLLGLEGDLLDAVVLGPRLPRGTRVAVKAFGAVGLTDRGMYDDKIICSHRPLSRRQRLLVVAFFRLYAKCKWVLNLLRGQAGRNACEGWGDALSAIARARRFDRAGWKGPAIRF